jgi:hypothetical protein
VKYLSNNPKPLSLIGATMLCIEQVTLCFSNPWENTSVNSGRAEKNGESPGATDN